MRLGNFHAGGGGQPQLPCHGGKGIYTQLPPDIVKKDVAAVFQSGAQIDRAAVAVLQAAGLVAAVKAVTAGAADGGSWVDARCQCRCGHRRLEGGSRGVQTLTDPVEQRCGAIGGKRGVVGAVGVQVEPRHICRRQNAAGAHIDYYGSPGAAFPPDSGGSGRAQGVDLAEQGILQHFLQCAVYGQYQRGPGACLPQLDGAAHRTVKAGVDQQPPVLPRAAVCRRRPPVRSGR